LFAPALALRACDVSGKATRLPVALTVSPAFDWRVGLSAADVRLWSHQKGCIMTAGEVCNRQVTFDDLIELLSSGIDGSREAGRDRTGA
jgi:hypothetical protein